MNKKLKIDVLSPAVGQYVPLCEVKDETFSSGVMGSGFGIIPLKGVIYAPVNGTVSMLFPTGHAMGFTAENGLEILVHIGIDTVNLNGKGFEVLKKTGDTVHANEPVIKFDIDAIKEAGLDPIVIVIYTNDSKYTIENYEAVQLVLDTRVAQSFRKEANVMKKDLSKYEYGAMCSEILEIIGGKENIANVFHCITRLRIVPVNRDLVDVEKLKNVKGILKVVESSGQIQCVIGTTVPEVFNEFIEISGVTAESTSTGNIKEKKPNLITRGLNTLASCVSPGLYAIVAGGMIKGIVALITALGLVDASSQIITVLNAVGDAPFYFMPFTVGFNAAKRFKVKEVFGIMTAGILMYSTFAAPAEGITSYAFGFLTIPTYNYKASIFPVILSVWIFSVIFHFIDKKMPKNLRIVFSGALSFLIAAPLFLAFAAPIGNEIAKLMTGTFAWLFTNAGPFAGALFCGIIPLTIIFGIKGWSAIELQNLSTLGYDYMLPNFFYSNLAVSGAILAYSLKQKPSDNRSAAISTGLVCILGITEPALYGYALPEKKPLYAAMLGGAIAGAVAMLLGVVTYAFSMPGITSIATYVDNGSNFLMLLITMAVAWGASFAISYAITKKEQ